ncbi:MAG: hypothetical protein NXY59_10180 [Aigarchaeota archaeon]|nr:hypothetical protein [Candidatus Pelearchaeum maunauluense]
MTEWRAERVTGGGAIFAGLLASDVVRTSHRSWHAVPPEEPAMMAALHLAALESKVVTILDQAQRMLGVFTCMDFISLLSRNLTNPWACLYRTPCLQAASDALLTAPSEPLNILLPAMRNQRTEYAAIRQEGRITAIIDTLDIAYTVARTRNMNELKKIKAREIRTQSPPTLSADSTIQECIKTMQLRKTGYILLEDMHKVITGRALMKYLLLTPAAAALRDAPHMIQETGLNDLTSHMADPVLVNREEDLLSILLKLLKSETYIAVTEDYEQTITPWDLTAGLQTLDEVGCLE